MNNKAIANALINYFNNSTKTIVEIYVDGLGWLIILTENIEIVSDNWFASTKYNRSTAELLSDDSAIVKLTNVYKLNSSFVENANNVKYNLMFDEIYICTEKISAFF